MTRYSVVIGSLVLAMMAGGCASRGEVSRIAARMDALEKNMVLVRTETATLTQDTNDLDRRLEYLEGEALRSGTPIIPWETVPQKSSGQPTAPVSSPANKPSPLPAPAQKASPSPTQTNETAPSAVASLPTSPAPGVEQTSSAQPAPMTSAPHPTAQKAYELARQLYVTGRFAEAEAAFQAFLEVYPTSKLVPNALYWKGETFYSRGRYSEAIFAFKDVQTRFPKDVKTPDSLLKTAMAYQKLGDQANMSLHLAVLFEDWPKAEATQRAKNMGLKP
jgi:tol-pal system protein YbgF